MEKKAVSLSTPLPNLPSQMLPETGHVRTSPAREKRATSEPRFFYLQNRNKTALTHSAVVPGQCISIGQVLGRYLAHSNTQYMLVVIMKIWDALPRGPRCPEGAGVAQSWTHRDRGSGLASHLKSAGLGARGRGMGQCEADQ